VFPRNLLYVLFVTCKSGEVKRMVYLSADTSVAKCEDKDSVIQDRVVCGLRQDTERI